ncbi:hypothetical protein D7Z26_18840 [Cohnella endophytica]|uniref:DUF5808 domain-containing protein n=1 Tax=Cohnella endophytica TaxID=2419778 RepID=A0A494XMH6_9BACL|nr:DUF5808 domain-containing protein [Cohnella endophytica]RKP49886.1 hypothetical protein D7Z26_18840 [Cohnella endophytica]
MAKRKWSNEEVEEYRRTRKQYLFYYNKDDANFLVPKSIGWGWTNNWAHPYSWLIILAVLALAVLPTYTKNN